MSDNQQTFDISTASILKAIIVVLFFVFLYVLKDVLIIFLFGLVIASAISPFANWLDQRRFPRLWGVLLLFLIAYQFIYVQLMSMCFYVDIFYF